MSSILIVEDEKDMRAGLRSLLQTEGYSVLEAENGVEALEKVESQRPSLVLLDLMIPQVDGFDVCRKIRALGMSTPVLILSAKSDEVDKVLGLELGADDYVTKPFSVRELVARIRALLRRSEGSTEGDSTVTIGETRLDLERCQGSQRGNSFELYHYELEILKFLLKHSGDVVSRQKLLQDVWGDSTFPTTRTVDFHICNLRKKIEVDPGKPQHILTVHGIGYRLVR